ncbi:MAG: tetratricopeptide repeat protein [Proteobacteria bacterium]|nr:tetratricopeptide repeat protein [Pseudomonadota bacterium]
MKIIPLRLIIQLVLGMALFFPAPSFSDQTDARLDELFTTLQSSENSGVLEETEVHIWAIWFESGRAEIDSLMEEAGVAVQSGQLAQAENLYSRVIKMAPGFSEGWNRRATVRYYQQDYSGSIKDIQQTLSLEPRHFGAIWGLGMILGRDRDFSGAITAFERLLEIKPNSRDAKPRIELLKQELNKSSV